MSNVILPKILDIQEKLALMKEDSKFEVASDSDAEATAIACASEIKSKPTLPKVPKVFVSGSCVFNCAYCGCRCSREEKSVYCNTPAETAQFAYDEAIKNNHGIFISSAIYKNADYTQELIAESVRIIREELFYPGYVHAKVMPGADPELIARTGQYASRLSVNIEVAHSSGYNKIAKQKNKENILTPMGNIAEQIKYAKYEKRKFAISQTTQLMAGSTKEKDRDIIILSKALYKKYNLKRVYYTPFQYKDDAKGYESENLEPVSTPYWRMSRLYQADRLLQLYGFSPDDITPENQPDLEEDIDPKASWALRHLNMYPVEVNTADFDTLIRVPGIGIIYAHRILEARKHCIITHEVLKDLKVSLKRCIYFITCNGKYRGGHVLSSPNIRNYLVSKDNNISIISSLVESSAIEG